MKRLLHNRYANLFAATVLLLMLAALFTWLSPRLPSAPRAVVQLGYRPDRLIFSPDGRFVVTYWSTKGDDALDLCDMKTGTHRTLLKRTWDYIDGIEFSPDGSRLATDHHGFTLWDVKTGETVAKKLGDGRDVRLSPDWRFLFVEEEGREDEPHQITILDLETQQRSRIEGGLGYHNDLIQFAPDGKRFALIQNKYDRILTVQLWGLTPRFGPQLLHEREFVADTWAITPDLTTAATVVTYSWPSMRSWVQLWDLDTGIEKACYLDSKAEATIDKILFTRQGQYLVGKYGSPDQTHLAPIFLDVNAGLEEIRLFAADGERSHGDSWIWCVANNKDKWGELTPATRGVDDRWMLCVDDNGANVWDMHRRQKHLTLGSQADKNNTMRRYHYSFSADGRYLLVSGFTGTRTDWSAALTYGRRGTADTTETYGIARLWDVERGGEIASFDDCLGGTLSPDGKTVVTFNGNYVRFWDVPPRRPFGPILALTTATWALTLLAVWRMKRRLRRWRRTTPEKEKRTQLEEKKRKPGESGYSCPQASSENHLHVAAASSGDG